MVRLFIPEGEGQHPLTRKRPSALPAQPDLIASPWRSSIAAAGFTGFLALIGRSSPGTFLRSAAFFSVADLSWTAAGLYGRREVNRGVFKMEDMKPEPGKLWERTRHWTMEDATLAGGGLGLGLALNPRALPGAYGISRFLGAATVGCAFGYKAGQTFLVRIEQRFLDLLDSSDKSVRSIWYEKLQRNNEAKASLSMIGKFALKYYTSPYLQILQNPLQMSSIHGVVSTPTRQHQAKLPGRSSRASVSDSIQAEATRFTLIHVEFKQDELAGPDLEAGYRGYKDDIESRDDSAIQERLDRVQSLKKQAAAELQLLWKQLSEKEQEFYSRVEEDREKDIFRRELQLLNNLTADLVARYAILGYHEADAQKQLQQKSRIDSIPPVPIPALDPSQISTLEPRGRRVVPEQVRLNWTRQREVLYHLEHTLSQYEAMELDEGSAADEHFKQLRQNAEELRRNIEATERLLQWFERQIQEAEQQNKDQA